MNLMVKFGGCGFLLSIHSAVVVPVCVCIFSWWKFYPNLRLRNKCELDLTLEDDVTGQKKRTAIH